jgi:hypothetical protein
MLMMTMGSSKMTLNLPHEASTKTTTSLPTATVGWHKVRPERWCANNGTTTSHPASPI